MKRYGSISSILLAAAIAAAPMASQAQFSPCVSAAVNVPPPSLPTYQQPPAPAPNYQWNPGYWAWNYYGYYWVPGVWVPAPATGLYWTPGYWNFTPTGYVWIQGYWGPSVGFYGGVNYGYGYFGVGFVGGYWSGGAFNYNTAVTNVNRTVVHNVYSQSGAIRGHTVASNRASFNGGHGGISAKPTSRQIAASRARRFGATPTQTRHAAMAGANGNNLVAFNHGKPPVTAVQKTSGTVRGQRDFKALTAHQQNVARGRAMSRVRIANAPTRHAQVASRGTSHGTLSAPAHHESAGSLRGAPGGGFRGAPGGGFRGAPGGGFRGAPGGGFRGGGRPQRP